MKKYLLILFLILGGIFSGCIFNKAKVNLDEFTVAVIEIGRASCRERV